MAADDAGTARPKIGPIAETFEHVLATLAKKLTAQNVGEEGLTSTMLGGLACVFPKIAERVPAINKDGPISCSWGNYSKGGAEVGDSEAHNGADFCLVLFDDAKNVRVALFQAKRVEPRASGLAKDKENVSSMPDASELAPVSVNIHRRPSKPDSSKNPGKEWREAQAVVLARTASCLALRKDDPSSKCGKIEAGAECPCFANDVNHSSLNWVHYLLYSDLMPSCFPISKITLDEFQKERDDGTTSNTIRASKNDQTLFLSLILSGILGEDQHWLKLKWEELQDRLPTLLDIMPVYVGDERTGGGLALKLAAGLDNIIEDFHTRPADPSAEPEASAVYKPKTPGR